MKMINRIPYKITVLCLALLLAACGGGRAEPTIPAEPVELQMLTFDALGPVERALGIKTDYRKRKPDDMRIATSYFFDQKGFLRLRVIRGYSETMFYVHDKHGRKKILWWVNFPRPILKEGEVLPEDWKVNIDVPVPDDLAHQLIDEQDPWRVFGDSIWVASKSEFSYENGRPSRIYGVRYEYTIPPGMHPIRPLPPDSTTPMFDHRFHYNRTQLSDSLILSSLIMKQVLFPESMDRYDTILNVNGNIREIRAYKSIDTFEFPNSYQPDQGFESIKLFQENGKVHRNVSAKLGRNTVVQDYLYNAQGDIEYIEEAYIDDPSFNVLEEYAEYIWPYSVTYSYDALGNWTRHKIAKDFEDESVLEETVMKIKYYPD